MQTPRFKSACPHTQNDPWTKQAVASSHSGDTATLVNVSNQMVTLSNNAVMSIYEIYPAYFIVMTSNVKGYFYNPSEPMTPGYYFATMYS